MKKFGRRVSAAGLFPKEERTMSTLDMEALKTVVAEGRRTAGTIAASAEMLSWRNRSGNGRNG